MTLVQYLVPCLTEDKIIKTGYRLSLPTSCPNNLNHEINPNGIKIINTQGLNNLIINQSSGIDNGEHFRFDSFLLNINNETESHDIIYPYNIEIYSIFLHVSSANLGDEISIFTHPNENIGFTLEDVKSNISSFKITSTAELNSQSESISFADLNPGILLSISDDHNTNDLGEIINIDNNTIYFSKPTVNEFSIGSKIFITICRVRNFIFNKTSNFQLGLSRIGSSGLKAGDIIRLIYKNNDKNIKSFSISAEIQY